MLKPLTVGILLILAAAAGFYIPRLMQYPSQSEFSVNLADPDPKWLEPLTANAAFACDAAIEAMAFENSLAGSKQLRWRPLAPIRCR